MFGGVSATNMMDIVSNVNILECVNAKKQHACIVRFLIGTVEPLLYDHPQNHIDVVV